MFKVITVSVSIFFLTAGSLFAQVGGYGIPSTYDVFGEDVVSGDIISFNGTLGVHEKSKVSNDETMFGVVDETPVVVFRSGVNRLPIVQIGEVLVNVTAVNGEIQAGDKITSSQIPGKGERFPGGEGYILGLALESFDGLSGFATTTLGGDEYAIGSIRVLLSIGPALADFAEPTPTSPSTIFVRESGEVETGLETIFRYITAALFALGTVFVVLKTFGPNIGKGVVSIGRNPLAKTSIQAMVVFNVILILSISIVSFIVSLLIIFLPI